MLNRLSLLALLLSAAFALAGAGRAGASTTQITILQDQTHVLGNPSATMAVLRSLGVSDVRIFLPWGAFAPHAASHQRPPGFDAADPAAYPAARWAARSWATTSSGASSGTPGPCAPSPARRSTATSASRSAPA